LTSAQQIQFKHYQSEEGFIAAGGHRSFAQDSLGFLWIGTGGGLYRFDGYTFKLYKREPNDSSTLLREGIGMMKIDPAGKLWLVYDEWLQSYDRNRDGFVTYRLLPTGNNIRSLFFESAESMWIGTYGTGLFHYNLKTGALKKYVNQPEGLLLLKERNYIYDITMQPPFVVMGTQDGIWKFHPASESFSRPNWKRKEDFSFDLETMLVNKIINKHDHYWISTPGKGMMKVDTSFAVLSRSPIGNEGTVVDIQGKVWVPTQGQGLKCYNPQTETTTIYKHEPDNPASLPSDLLWESFIDKDQNIWLGVWNGGICQIKRPSISIRNYLAGHALHHPMLLEGKNERMLLVTSAGEGLLGSPFNTQLTTLDFRSMVSSLPKGYTDLFAIHRGKENIWIGSFGRGALGIDVDKETGMIGSKSHLTTLTNTGMYDLSDSGPVTTIYEDPQRNLWLGVMGGGLNRVYLEKRFGEEGAVKIYQHDDKDSTSMAAVGWISGILPENDSLLWVSSYGGLELFHYKSQTFEHIVQNIEGAWLSKSKDGTILFGTKRGLFEGRKDNGHYSFRKIALPNDPFITSVEEDIEGRFWIGTLQGLYCLDQRDSSLLLFNSDDGLVKLSHGGSTITREGLMIFAGGNGLSVIDPMSLTRRSNKIRPVITQLIVDSKIASAYSKSRDDDHFTIQESVNSIRQLELDHTHKTFSIEFASMDLTAPIKILYRHQLEGFDPDWVETDSYHRSATYQNLGPGVYHFKVKATNADGVWSNYQTTLDIRILPAPWKTWWAYSGYSLIVVCLLFGARRMIVQRERLKANLKLAVVEQQKEHFELEKAREVDRVKSSFFTNISHEFRTPLTLIKGPVGDLLEKYTNDPKTQEKLKLVQRNADLLLRLINQLLDLAKLESGSLKVEKSEGELYSFIRAVASSFESLARQKNITLSVEVPTSPQPALFDKDKVETILINLINNAIKFTPQGGKVTMKGTLKDLTAEALPIAIGRRRGILGLTVSDTGIGIPPEHQSKIFERFHQVSEAHKEVGTGIGLSLVKELVVLMEGTIIVKSEVGKGAEFTVTLPLELFESLTGEEGSGSFGGVNPKRGTLNQDPGYPVSSIENSRVNGEESTTKPHVLVVEDNTDLRHFIIDSLGDEFYYLEGENGVQGLEKATTEVPDLIISDVMMPEMDGMEMTKKIKSDIRTSHIPLILLTAKSSEDSKLSGLECGADDYLTKPFNKQELLLKVRNGVNRQLKLREKLRGELMSSAPRVEVLSADEQFLIKVKDAILSQLSDEQLSVESLAEDIGLSRVQLYRKVSGLTGISVNELIRKLRLQKAAHLLGQAWGPVSQVAYEVGFSNLSYFSKVFKEEFGVLPSEYERI